MPYNNCGFPLPELAVRFVPFPFVPPIIAFKFLILTVLFFFSKFRIDFFIIFCVLKMIELIIV